MVALAARDVGRIDPKTGTASTRQSARAQGGDLGVGPAHIPPTQSSDRFATLIPSGAHLTLRVNALSSYILNAVQITARLACSRRLIGDSGNNCLRVASGYEARRC